MSYFVEDETVATVNVKGVITGKKIGTTKVRAVLSGGSAGDIEIEFTISVVDKVAGIRLSAPQSLRIAPGTELNGEKLKELGVTGLIEWASGKVEGEVDLSSARITGYDAEKEGEQEITIRVNVDGKSVTGKITILVSANGCSCGGSVGFCRSACQGWAPASRQRS